MRLCFVPTLVGLMLGTSQSIPAETPLPPPRPPGIEHERPSAAAATEPSPASSELSPEELQACLAQLTQSGARAEPAQAIGNGACGAKSPIKILTLPGDPAVAPPAIVTCAVAEALAKWAADSVKAEAERHLTEVPKKILIGTSYECRGRNRQPGAKLSEHAFANAVDVMGFEFRKRRAIPIASRADETPEAMFLGAVRAQACTYFTTVLGPGSDAAHANHLHLDMRERKRGAKLCQ
jgi:hypothetical protein